MVKLTTYFLRIKRFNLFVSLRECNSHTLFHISHFAMPYYWREFLLQEVSIYLTCNFLCCYCHHGYCKYLHMGPVPIRNFWCLEQLVAVTAIFEKFLPFRAFLEQNVALNHISNTKKSTISWKIIFYTDFLNVYNLTSRLLTGPLRPYLLMGDLYGSANDPRTANDPDQKIRNNMD